VSYTSAIYLSYLHARRAKAVEGQCLRGVGERVQHTHQACCGVRESDIWAIFLPVERQRKPEGTLLMLSSEVQNPSGFGNDEVRKEAEKEAFLTSVSNVFCHDVQVKLACLARARARAVIPVELHWKRGGRDSHHPAPASSRQSNSAHSSPSPTPSHRVASHHVACISLLGTAVLGRCSRVPSAYLSRPSTWGSSRDRDQRHPASSSNSFPTYTHHLSNAR
jgi:hypothetical protein